MFQSFVHSLNNFISAVSCCKPAQDLDISVVLDTSMDFPSSVGTGSIVQSENNIFEQSRRISVEVSAENRDDGGNFFGEYFEEYFEECFGNRTNDDIKEISEQGFAPQMGKQMGNQIKIGFPNEGGTRQDVNSGTKAPDRNDGSIDGSMNSIGEEHQEGADANRTKFSPLFSFSGTGEIDEPCNSGICADINNGEQNVKQLKKVTFSQSSVSQVFLATASNIKRGTEANDDGNLFFRFLLWISSIFTCRQSPAAWSYIADIIPESARIHSQLARH